MWTACLPLSGEACVYPEDLGRYLGIPRTCAPWAWIRRTSRSWLRNAMKDATAATNPRKATKDQIIAIFQKAYDD